MSKPQTALLRRLSQLLSRPGNFQHVLILTRIDGRIALKVNGGKLERLGNDGGDGNT